MVKIKSLEEIELMRESALIVSRTLGMLAKEIKPGVTTLHLDRLAEALFETTELNQVFGMYDFQIHFV